MVAKKSALTIAPTRSKTAYPKASSKVMGSKGSKGAKGADSAPADDGDGDETPAFRRGGKVAKGGKGKC